ncbi:MAG: hypothetical protein J6Q74_04130 [Clostridia bacterium]|nr:hypothetical protein [Clostridia bacterium]
MKQNLSIWQFGGFTLAVLGGTLLHFLYDWTNGSSLVSPFSSINESTWEHMKLLYFPMLLFALLQSSFFKEYKNFWCVKLIGVLSGLLLIPVIFYTYNGVFGKSPDWINITIFFIAAAVAFILEWTLFKKNTISCKRPWLAFAIILFIGILFVVFTFFTPELPLFEEPSTRTC